MSNPSAPALPEGEGHCRECAYSEPLTGAAAADTAANATGRAVASTKADARDDFGEWAPKLSQPALNLPDLADRVVQLTPATPQEHRLLLRSLCEFDQLLDQLSQG